MLPRRTQGNLLKVDYNSRYLFVYSFIYPCIHSSINITNFFTPRWLNNHVIPDSSAHHFSFNHCEAKKRKKGHNISSIHFPRGTRSPRIPQKKKNVPKSQVSLGAYAKKSQHQHADCQHHTRTLVSIFVETHVTMGFCRVKSHSIWKFGSQTPEN